MKHKHHELFESIANGESVEEFECLSKHWTDAKWRIVDERLDAIYKYQDTFSVRRKPKMLELAGVTFPEPMRVAPADGTIFWLVETNADVSYPRPWSGGRAQERWLAYGLCQATEQGATAQRRAMILSVGGEP